MNADLRAAAQAALAHGRWTAQHDKAGMQFVTSDTEWGALASPDRILALCDDLASEQMERADAERDNERLRVALKRLADLWDEGTQVGDLARAALEGKPTE